LAIASAALGDESAARQHFALAEPRLVARKIEPVLKRAEEALLKMGIACHLVRAWLCL
jgi:hypothetical protein